MQTESTTGEIRIHRVLAGPFHSSDVPGNEEEDFYWIECLIEVGNGLEEVTLAHDDFDPLYDIVKHMSKPTVEPFIIRGGND